MRSPLRTPPVVLTVAGTDCSGGAGIQADVDAIEANGGRAATAVTAVTAQNAERFLATASVPESVVGDQLEAVFQAYPVAAVKSGMLANAAIVRQLAETLRRRRPAHYVCDPVLAATRGTPLLEPGAIDTLRRELFPLATLVTPNLDEVRKLTGIEVTDSLSAERAARRMLQDGAAAVLIKGGHRRDRPASDLLVRAEGAIEIPGVWIDAAETRGTGCRLASAIATRLAMGRDLLCAAEEAKRFVSRTLAGSPGDAEGLHVILDETLQTAHAHVALARMAAEGGADVVQYREKRPLPTRERVATASAVIEASREHGTRVIVNDRADVAAASGAHGVHLGRHDLDPLAARRVLGRRTMIGGTANDPARARELDEQAVDYIGVGPVFGTRSKADPAPALGLEQLGRIVRSVETPVIAIGGITPDRVASVLATGARGVAVLSAVVCQSDPQAATRRFRIEIDRFDQEEGGRQGARSGARVG